MANGLDNIFIQKIRDPEYQQRVIHELFATACGQETRYEHQKQTCGQPSIDGSFSPLINAHLEYRKRAYDQNGHRRFQWEKKDEYGVFRDEHGYARVLDGRSIHASKEDVREILERASTLEHTYICLPEDTELFKLINPAPDT
ncbi:hypothetical protein Bca4012_063392 [Brassica carinata]